MSAPVRRGLGRRSPPCRSRSAVSREAAWVAVRYPMTAVRSGAGAAVADPAERFGARGPTPTPHAPGDVAGRPRRRRDAPPPLTYNGATRQVSALDP
jgi:hypothetical protein